MNTDLRMSPGHPFKHAPQQAQGLFLLLACLLSACTLRVPRADWQASGLIDCVPAGSVNGKGEPQTCETSGILIRGEQVLMANDKAVLPPASAVFAMPKSALADGHVPYSRLQFQQGGVLAEARKIEELSSSQQQALNLAITAFDRTPATEKKNAPAFNNLLAWQGTNPQSATRWPLGERDSMSLRPALQAALADADHPEGPDYFKIEGMSFDDRGNLWLGVRETGVDYAHPIFRRWLLEAHYAIGADGQFELEPKFERIELDAPSEDLRDWGLSALLYDPWRRGLWVGLSREVGEGQPLQARLFFLPQRALKSGRLRPVAANRQTSPWIAPHKIEGLAFADRNTLIAICDEDRTQSTVRVNGESLIRQLHQGVYLRITLH